MKHVLLKYFIYVFQIIKVLLLTTSVWTALNYGSKFYFKMLHRETSPIKSKLKTLSKTNFLNSYVLPTTIITFAFDFTLIMKMNLLFFNIKENAQFIQNKTFGLWEQMIAQLRKSFCKIPINTLVTSVMLLCRFVYAEALFDFQGWLENVS